jgi:hypothetical protein
VPLGVITLSNISFRNPLAPSTGIILIHALIASS